MKRLLILLILVVIALAVAFVIVVTKKPVSHNYIDSRIDVVTNYD